GNDKRVHRILQKVKSSGRTRTAAQDLMASLYQLSYTAMNDPPSWNQTSGFSLESACPLRRPTLSHILFVVPVVFVEVVQVYVAARAAVTAGLHAHHV